MEIGVCVASHIGDVDYLARWEQILRELGSAGLRQVRTLPNFDTRYAVLERVARDPIGQV